VTHDQAAPAARPALTEAANGGRSIERVCRVVTAAILIGLGIATIVRSLQAMLGLGLIDHPDLDAYLMAAERLKAGEPLYPAIPAGVSQEADFLYRYAPWFAVAFIPATLLPREVVAVTWDLVLIVATVLVVLPFLRTRTLEGVALGIFLGGVLMEATAFANVHALLLLPLVYRLEHRDGPVWIALAASIKAFPLLLVIVYLGRLQWQRVAITLALTAVLVAPMLALDLSHYPRESGGWLTLTDWPVVYVAVVGTLIVTALRYAHTRWAWLLAAVTMILASPRIHTPYLAGLSIAMTPVRRDVDIHRVRGSDQSRRT